MFAHGQSVTTFLRTVIPLYLLFEHDLFGKPAATFPDHAPVGEIEIVTISLYEASVGVFVPYLGNLSDLLDRASAHAKARNIDPVVLLNMRLYPNMYNLTRQVGEANRHAVVGCALLAGRAPHTFGDSEPTSPNSNRGYRRPSSSCMTCRGPRSIAPRTRKWCSHSGAERRAVLQGGRCC